MFAAYVRCWSTLTVSIASAAAADCARRLRRVRSCMLSVAALYSLRQLLSYRPSARTGRRGHALKIRSRVSALGTPGPLTARDTVSGETPASRASARSEGKFRATLFSARLRSRTASGSSSGSDPTARLPCPSAVRRCPTPSTSLGSATTPICPAGPGIRLGTRLIVALQRQGDRRSQRHVSKAEPAAHRTRGGRGHRAGPRTGGWGALLARRRAPGRGGPTRWSNIRRRPRHGGGSSDADLDCHGETRLISANPARPRYQRTPPRLSGGVRRVPRSTPESLTFSV